MGRGSDRVRGTLSVSNAPQIKPHHRRRGRAGRAVPVARAGAGRRRGLPDRGAGRRQFPRAGAARRHQPSGDARAVRPHRPLREARTARHHRAAVPLLGPPRGQADRRVRPRPAQGRHPLPLRAAMRAHQDRRGGAQARQGAPQYRASPRHRLHVVHARRRRRDRTGDQSGGRDRDRFAAPIWSAAKVRAASSARTSTSSSKASPIRTAP